MKINLVKQLEKKHLQEAKKAFSGNQFIKEDILNQANQLLLEVHNEDLSTLEELGIHQVKFEKELTSKVVRSNKIQEIYNKPAFTGSEIKYFCNLYYLKLLPISHYKGAIPTELAKIVREFCKDRKMTVSEASNDLYILAPVEMFETTKFKPDPKQDPILFYRDPERKTSTRHSYEVSENDFFVQVYNWGNDFSLTRRFIYLFNNTARGSENISSFWATFWGLLFIISGFLLGYTIPIIGLGTFFFIIGSIILMINSIWDKFIDKLWNKNEI
jgi:hypothetical protein